MRRSIADYLLDFERLGGEQAYAERRGYRVARESYAKIAANAYRFARELDARDIRKGDRVMLWGPNSAVWIAAFLGCANRGVVAVPMDHAASSDFANRVFQQIGAKLLVCSNDHSQSDLPTFHFEDFDAALAKHSPARLDAEKVSPDDPLEIVFTSGTTAEPRGVVISHGNVLSN